MKKQKFMHGPIITGQTTGLQKFLHDFTLYKKHFPLFVMFMPVIAYYIIFRYLPMGGIVLAFKDYKIKDGIWGSEWIGLENFQVAFSAPFFLRALKNSIIISVQKTVFGFPAPIILALMLNEIRHIKYKRVTQTISYLPHFLSWVVLAGLFQNILSPNTGMLNYILVNWFGFAKGIHFLGTASMFRPTLVITEIWKGVGWGSIVYIATISGIDPQLYEAAVCDGASRWQRMTHITLPSLMPTITILLIMNVGGILDAGFDQIFNLYNPAVYSTGDIIDTYVYRLGLGDMRYSFATAVGLFKNVIGFILVIGTNTVAKKINDTGIW